MTVDIKVQWYFITLDIFKRVMQQFHFAIFTEQSLALARAGL